jgi:hypothetical protein
MKLHRFVVSGLRLSVFAVLFAGASQLSAQFVNGGFEDGTFNGWTRGSGYWTGGWPINPSSYFPGGSNYNSYYDASAIVTQGDDPVVGSLLKTVYAGKYAVRANDWNNNYSVSTLRQTVTNYQDSSIYFEWAAVLEASHDSTDSDNFTLKLTNDTKGITLYQVSYNSHDNGSIFNSYGYWYYTDWQVQNLDVSAYIGDTFTLELLASDCPYGGHAGYVYLDGFANVIVNPGDNNGAVPEPSTYGMIGAGALLAGVLIRRRFSKR